MSKTSVKTFLTLLKQINNDMDTLATEGAELVNRANEIDFNSITATSTEEELNDLFNETRKNFLKLDNMKQTLFGGLQRKVIRELDAATPSSRIKSATARRRSRSSSNRGTRRFRSI
jgi:hypothetical protein